VNASASGRDVPGGSLERRPALLLVSALTALWLALELFAVTTSRATTWPFSALGMFSAPRQEAVVLSLTGGTAEGTRHIDEDDFGFAGGNQLHAYVRLHIANVNGRSVTVRSQAAAAARALIGLYDKRHDQPLKSLAVYASVTELSRRENSYERRFRLIRVAR
jgi:hypothetical protein